MQPGSEVQVVASSVNAPILYNPSDARIAEVKAEVADVVAQCRPVLCEKCLPTGKRKPKCKDCKPAPIVLAEDEATAKLALKKLVPLRTELERCRKALKEDALRHGQRIDAEARRLNSQILESEDPIQEALEEIEENARARAEAKVKAEEEAAAAERKRLADIEAEKKRLEDEARAAEAKKLADERAAFEREKREQAEKQAAEQALRDARQAELDAQAKKLADEQARLDRERKEAAEKIEREKREAEDKIRREKEAAELKLRLEAEAKAKAEAELKQKQEAERLRLEAEEAERKAVEAAKPDLDKIHGFGRDLQMGIATMFPQVTAASRAALFLVDVRSELEAIAAKCIEFKMPKRSR